MNILSSSGNGYAFYNTEAYEQLILQKRKDRQTLKRILVWYAQQIMVVDEIVLLANILSICDKNNLAISKNEVRRAFNLFYHEEDHGKKEGYFLWLYSAFRIKHGTIVQSKKCRSNVSKKSQYMQTYNKKEGCGVSFLDKCSLDGQTIDTHSIKGQTYASPPDTQLMLEVWK